MSIQSSFNELSISDLTFYPKNYSDLSDVISSSIFLINSFITYHKKNRTNLLVLNQLNKNLNSIYVLLQKAVEQENLENFVNERQKLHELYQLISHDFANCCTDEMLCNEELKNWLHKFKWFLLVIDQDQYVELALKKTIHEGSRSYRSASIIILEHAFELPWEQFCSLIRPLIINFYGSIDHLFINFQRNFFIHTSKSTLLFLDQKKASPKELVSYVPSEPLSYINQSFLGCVLNYGAETPFPEHLNFRFDDARTWEVALDLCSSYKINYQKYTTDELYRTVKFFEKYYQGKNPQFLIERQKIIKVLGFDQPGFKTISHYSLNLPLDKFKVKMNELLSVFKRTDQKFKIENTEFSLFKRNRKNKIENIYTPIFTRFSLKILLNSEFSPKDYCTRRRSFSVLTGSETYNITFDQFLGIIYPSIRNPPKQKIHLNEIINNQFSNITSKYKTTSSSRVIENAIRFWKNEKIELMSPQENFDLFSLFSRAQIECQELEDAVKTTQLSKEDWKNMFIKWDVS